MEESQRKYLETMYFKYSEKLLRMALRLTGSEDTAYELIQNTFITAIGSWADFSACPSPEGWLVKTLKFLAMNELRRRSREVPLEEAMEVPAPPNEDTDFEECLPRELSEEDRQLLIWKYKDRRTQREIADLLGVSPSVSANRISRALSRLRALLGSGPGP